MKESLKTAIGIVIFLAMTVAYNIKRLPDFGIDVYQVINSSGETLGDRIFYVMQAACFVLFALITYKCYGTKPSVGSFVFDMIVIWGCINLVNNILGNPTQDQPSPIIAAVLSFIYEMCFYIAEWRRRKSIFR